MKSKKGAIELQFSWIFILIAGALILTFFVLIVQKQKEVADVKLTSAIKADLSTILTGSRVSRGTSSLVDIPDVEIRYDCDGYSVGDLGAINPGISFSPDVLKGDNLMMWSLDWNVPFRVDNFLFITSPEVRYIFMINGPTGSKKETLQTNEFNDIYNSEEKPSFPPRTIIQDGEEKILFNKWMMNRTNLPKLDDLNNYKIRVVYKTDKPTFASETYNLPNFVKDMLPKDVTRVRILPDSSCGTNIFDCFGNVDFYEKQEHGRNFNCGTPNCYKGRSYYLGRASVIAAVFADDIEYYNCQMRKAFRKLEMIAQIYLDKVTQMEAYYSSTGNINCQMIGNAKSSLQIIIDNAKVLADGFTDSAGIDEIREIYGQMSSLEGLNNNLQRLSCAEIY